MPNSTICLTFDFDAMSVWFGYSTVTPAMLYRGEYGANVGVPRVLDLLRRYDLRATFFIPGHTIDSFPEVVATVLEAGHEVAHHSYAHVDPSQQTPDEERRDMERALTSLEQVGVKPLGFRSPSADFSSATLGLLEEYGFQYDSSLMADDFRPYHPRLGDQVTQQTPLVKGRPARLWELPMSFEFDDWVHFQFNFNPYRNGTSAPSKVLEIWTADLDWMHTHLDGGILTVAMHPQVIGRGHRIAMLEQFIQHGLRHSNVRFERMGDVAQRLG
ncbi:MAG: polysaccharide deacetylase [Anaerolineae bacterium]|nr:polysaccharide deacetylase [Anaerolineae bacterium]